MVNVNVNLNEKHVGQRTSSRTRNAFASNRLDDVVTWRSKLFLAPPTHSIYRKNRIIFNVNDNCSDNQWKKDPVSLSLFSIQFLELNNNFFSLLCQKWSFANNQLFSTKFPNQINKNLIINRIEKMKKKFYKGISWKIYSIRILKFFNSNWTSECIDSKRFVAAYRNFVCTPVLLWANPNDTNFQGKCSTFQESLIKVLQNCLEFWISFSCPHLSKVK